MLIFHLIVMFFLIFYVLFKAKINHAQEKVDCKEKKKPSS